MDIDSVHLVKPTSSRKKKSRRVEKRRTKPRNQMVFKSMVKRKRGTK